MNHEERDRAIEHLQREVRKLWRALYRIEDREFNEVLLFQASLEKDMPQNPGATAVIDFTPIPANATLTQPPTITSSDPTNAPVTADATGLIATVNFPPSAAVGTNYTLTCSYTNPDGTTATGTFSGTIVAAVVDVTSFTSAEVS
jgi:hypothetical protein